MQHITCEYPANTQHQQVKVFNAATSEYEDYILLWYTNNIVNHVAKGRLIRIYDNSRVNTKLLAAKPNNKNILHATVQYNDSNTSLRGFSFKRAGNWFSEQL